MKNCKKNTETTESDLGTIKDFKTTTEVSHLCASSSFGRVQCFPRAHLFGNYGSWFDKAQLTEAVLSAWRR